MHCCLPIPSCLVRLAQFEPINSRPKHGDRKVIISFYRSGSLDAGKEPVFVNTGPKSSNFSTTVLPATLGNSNRLQDEILQHKIGNAPLSPPCQSRPFPGTSMRFSSPPAESGLWALEERNSSPRAGLRPPSVARLSRFLDVWRLESGRGMNPQVSESQPSKRARWRQSVSLPHRAPQPQPQPQPGRGGKSQDGRTVGHPAPTPIRSLPCADLRALRSH